ncbi:peroxiredoxin family protein [Bacillus sp. N1-1]|jgi:peroxiredoxin|uniref:peroxiredoxin family protein n=1 Tax=Bacillus sp. N1-1 TaxID=2682541 RepID=UPI001316596C|nr:peroxiredoxin family protein [Bacillus sp. N1-1]QHA93232.1 redoxin domain-containing protein [Bacillus sp. N1-1]
MAKLKLGDQAPSFSLINTEGELFQFEQHQQEDTRWHMLVFFRGEWCPVCNEQLEELQEHLGAFQKLDVHPIAIAKDELESLRKMKEKHGLEFPVLSDNENAAIDSYGVMMHREDDPYEDHGEHGEPAIFLIDENGKLMAQFLQSSPFGRPSPDGLITTIKYIRKNKA